jgi:peptide/nickel transport system substrate-binding protein
VTVVVLALTGACRAPGPDRSSSPSSGGELVASHRSEPASYNRYMDASAAGDALALLTQAPLIRVDRVSDRLEPWLAESWTQSDDGLSYTVKLRRGVTFSDGVPLTSSDVVFSFAALFDPTVAAPLASGAQVSGNPLVVTAADASTVVVRFPSPFAPGLRVIGSVPILPKHKLEEAYKAGAFKDAWASGTPPSQLAGLGPFVLTEHVPGQRLVFSRNPRYWRKDASGVTLPYLDRLTVLVIPDQNTEAIRMAAGEMDLMSNGDIRPEDYATFKRVSQQGKLTLLDLGVGLDPNLLWFNLSPAKARDPRSTWLGQKAFRQAISCAVDRQKIVDTVYLGAAEPIFGPVTSGNRTWFASVRPACEHDAAKARSLLASVGLTDRNGDGMLEDAKGAPARFSILSQAGHIRGRTATVLQAELKQIGLAVDVVTLDPPGLSRRWMDGDYDTIYFGVQSSSTDPALNAEFWYSSGIFHFWNRKQAAPATDWERRIDDLMRQLSAAGSLEERQRLFAEVQRVFADELPAIYFVAPKVTIAVSTRLVNPRPVLQIPQLLWSADTLAAAGPR